MRNIAAILSHMLSRSLTSLPSIDNMSLFRFGFSRTSDEIWSKSQEETEQEQPTSREKYKQKRKKTAHEFQKEWLSEFAWLDCNKEGRQMLCKVCKDFPNIADKISSIFSGSKRFHLSNIKGHNQSRRHAKCVEAQKAREALASTPIHLGLRNLNSMSEEKLVKLLNTVYYMAKKEQPSSDFKELCMLQVKNGVRRNLLFRTLAQCVCSLVIVKNSSPPPTVGLQITDRLPTGCRQSAKILERKNTLLKPMSKPKKNLPKAKNKRRKIYQKQRTKRKKLTRSKEQLIVNPRFWINMEKKRVLKIKFSKKRFG